MAHRALITGMSGFVGSFLAEHLLACGDAVLGTSPNGRWEAASSPELPGRVELVAWDHGAPGGLAQAARRQIAAFCPEVIYHLAAVSVPRDCGDAEPLPAAWAINVEGARQVLDLAASLPRRPRVVFASSSHVYAGPPREAPRVDERSPVGPVGAYGRTKLAAEAEMLRAVEQGAEVVVARSFPHTGPRQNPRMMLPQWARQFARGGNGPVEVFTLDAHLDLSDVRDVVRAYRLLAERGQRGEVYNVGSGVACRSGAVFELLCRLAASRRPALETRPGFRQEPIADASRLVRETGWRATIPLEQTVADTLAWWQRELAKKA